nr:uncharacterized protein LOC115255492 [Aedes albopictus]
MVRGCCIGNCDSKYSDGKFSFHQIPTGTTNLQIQRRKLWISAISRTDINYRHAKVCSKHFETGKPAAYNETDKVNWIPTLFLDENQQITEYDDVDLQATGTANTTGQYLLKEAGHIESVSGFSGPDEQSLGQTPLEELINTIPETIHQNGLEAEVCKTMQFLKKTMTNY